MPKYLIIMALCLSIGKIAYALDMAKIQEIESSNNPKAYNKVSQAKGLYQITPICLKEYNQFHKVKYASDDLFIAKINYKVANWYLNVRIPQLLRYYKLPINDTYKLICFNAGINWAIKYHKGYKLPKETQNYLGKILKKER